MLSLGQASDYSFRRTMRHLFARGSAKDSEQLRSELAKRYGAKVENVALYHSGRSALAVALMKVGKKGDKVIVPGLTCIAVIRAIKAAGMEPVFADITREGLEYDYEKLEKQLQGNVTGANGTIDKNAEVCYNGMIVVQNTLGQSWNVRKIEELAKKYQLKIVEDLAHSAGRFYPDGREVGTVGEAVALSFGKGKAIDIINGGAVVLRGHRELEQPEKLPKLAERARDRWYPVLAGICRGTWRIGLGKALMTVFVKLGFVKRSADTELNINVKLTDWQAKLACEQLGSLPKEALRGYKFVRDRDELLKELDRAGYNFSEIWYNTPVSPARYRDEVDFPEAECPETVWIAKHIINLPTWYPEKKLEKARAIIAKYEIGGRDE